jgi:hypothetical protein
MWNPFGLAAASVLVAAEQPAWSQDPASLAKHISGTKKSG